MIWARALSDVAATAPPGLVSTSLAETVWVSGLTEQTRQQLQAAVGPQDWLASQADAALVRISLVHPPPCESVALQEAFERLRKSREVPEQTALGKARFEWGGRPKIMAILNATPDSFSDGGQFSYCEDAIAHGLSLAEAGADLLDVGGESTRPGAQPVSETEELRRVLPVIEGLLARRADLLISIDTQKPAVARAAVRAGAALVNDVSGLRHDAMLDVLAETGAAACAMHMQGNPQTMQAAPRYGDVVTEVMESLELALRRAEARGIERSRLWVDPGIGFGKTTGHNLKLLQRAADFRQLGVPVVWGVSRKRFLGVLLGDVPPSERVGASAAVAAVLAAHHAADVLRVHDVKETMDAVKVGHALAQASEGGADFGS